MTISTQLMKKLLEVPIFAGLTGGEAAEFFDAALELTEPAGKVLFREGDASDALLVVLEGSVSVSRRGIELARVGQHAVLGEMTLVDEREPRTATATALEDVRLLKLPSRRVQKLLKAGSLGALKVVANLALVMSKRLAAINEKLVVTLGDKGKKKEELADFNRILTRWEF